MCRMGGGSRAWRSLFRDVHWLRKSTHEDFSFWARRLDACVELLDACAPSACATRYDDRRALLNREPFCAVKVVGIVSFRTQSPLPLAEHRSAE